MCAPVRESPMGALQQTKGVWLLRVVWHVVAEGQVTEDAHFLTWIPEVNLLWENSLSHKIQLDADDRETPEAAAAVLRAACGGRKAKNLLVRLGGVWEVVRL
eukprot:NODE_12111_length_391_cov_3.154971_g10968_i0.p2 GENE.NODE_12111_length_391_cov_3.154971_g10968_i0~~NODE_12111_length_391_cov_3.154971_g10968_i0.p2  ORF type:complete len:102 (-),score=27.42 NODE_12111_length_391_cov_3.154971_g10968_i0:12-317(-)